MKRSKLIKQLEKAGYVLLRHGGRHDIYQNISIGRKAPVPRHRDIPPTLVRLFLNSLAFKKLNIKRKKKG